MRDLIGKRVKAANGSIGVITGVNFDGTVVNIEFYDGKDADPLDPKFPVYNLVIRVDDLELINTEEQS